MLSLMLEPVDAKDRDGFSPRIRHRCNYEMRCMSSTEVCDSVNMQVLFCG